MNARHGDVFFSLLLVPSLFQPKFFLQPKIFHYHPLPHLLKPGLPSPTEDPDTAGKPDAIYTSQQVDGGVTWHRRVPCCACEEFDWGWDAELVGEEEQEVVLTLTLLLEWLIFVRRWEILFGFGSWIMALMIFTIFLRSLFDRRGRGIE